MNVEIATDVSVSYFVILDQLVRWLSRNGVKCYARTIFEPPNSCDLRFYIAPFHPQRNPDVFSLIRTENAEGNIWITDCEGLPILSEYQMRLVNSLEVKICPGSNFTWQNLKKAEVNIEMKVVPRAVEHELLEAVKPAFSSYDYIIFIAASYWGMKHQRKGIEEAYEAMRLVNMKYPKLALYHITTNYPEAIGIRLPKDANIIIDQGFGNKSYEEIISLIKGAKMLIAPSHCEGFGLTALEAMACKTPLVYTDCPAQNEFAVGEKVPCYTVEKEMTKYGMLNELHLYKPEDLAQAILNVYENPSYAQELAEKAYEKSLEYNPDKVFPKYF